MEISMGRFFYCGESFSACSVFRKVFHKAFYISFLRPVPISPHRSLAAAPRFQVLLVSCLAMLFILGACGYRFAGSGGQAPGDIRSVAVDVLENRTADAGIESLFTNAILNEFIRWKKLPVKPRGEADAVLAGRISSISTEDVSHVRVEQTLETRVTVTLALTLKRTGTNEVLWQNQGLSYFQEYVETGNALSTQRNRREALREIAEFLAEKIHQNIFEGF